ncbi:hypothetical protein [Propionicimonas sp.]|uniref:hypothetical protein n=1 Tax=Propionicimonas sp. TaxID=1955623 RepID=UPI0018376D1E|nr:hypothetical protein [Propionicimonas sp.]MBU3976756.1 hypothetical protein [Actinomycetota bacterium]MBA3019821.1 hypothetical protein [Propionicimonas sp.]MBU3986851.1 hypothetical protein [Actinomycetota bacterium]MBU4006763.1 hypothetical protein [Actinomycetota bacterium]MBU4065463.1 hypothetical protein [Actinomycetota bacterium]
MRIARSSITILACALAISGCTPPAPGTPTVPAGSPPPSVVAPPGFDLDSAAAVPLAIGADGGNATLTSGEWTAVVSVPGGSAPAGANWTLTPLRTAPGGLVDALAPGIYVDEAGQAPTGDCVIAFAVKGKPHADASIVKLADDGSVAEVVATVRQETKGGTLLLAEVTGFSPYSVAKASAAARKTAKQKRDKQAKKLYVISVHDSVKFTKADWKLEFTLDLDLAGGSANSSGAYTGNATLSVTGQYTKDLGVHKGKGKIKGSAKGTGNAFLVGLPLAPLPPLGDDFPYQMEEPTGTGTMSLASSGSLSVSADTPQGPASIPVMSVNGKDLVPYRIKVEGTNVTVEIANVGEFSGHLVKF